MRCSRTRRLDVLAQMIVLARPSCSQGVRDRQSCIDGAAFFGHLPSDIGAFALQLLDSNEVLPRLLREPSGLSLDGVETVAQPMAR
jgi:hypothetical protein